MEPGLSYRLDGLGFRLWQAKEIFLLFKCPDWLRAHKAAYSMGTRVLALEGESKAAGACSGSTDLHLLLRLQMNETVLLLSLYAFMAQTGTTLALTVCNECH